MKIKAGNIYIHNYGALKIIDRNTDKKWAAYICYSALPQPYTLEASLIKVEVPTRRLRAILGGCHAPSKKELAKIKLILDW